MFSAAASTTTARPQVPVHVVQQHGEEAAILRHTRSVLVRAPHVGLLLPGRQQTDTAALVATLRHGTQRQRQRRHAAPLLAVAQLQQTLLPVAAPAWRQRCWVAAAAA